jgi:hypothetical protein
MSDLLRAATFITAVGCGLSPALRLFDLMSSGGRTGYFVAPSRYCLTVARDPPGP